MDSVAADADSSPKASAAAAELPAGVQVTVEAVTREEAEALSARARDAMAAAVASAAEAAGIDIAGVQQDEISLNESAEMARKRQGEMMDTYRERLARLQAQIDANESFE